MLGQVLFLPLGTLAAPAPVEAVAQTSGSIGAKTAPPVTPGEFTGDVRTLSSKIGLDQPADDDLPGPGPRPRQPPFTLPSP